MFFSTASSISLQFFNYTLLNLISINKTVSIDLDPKKTKVVSFNNIYKADCTIKVAVEIIDFSISSN